MIRLVDLEASSLLPGGFPIEAAWVDEDGRGESHLIRPWKRWLRRNRDVPERSPASADVDGISLDQLMDTGEPVKEVARRAAETLFAPGVITVSQQHAYDRRMLDTLFRAGGVAQHVGLKTVSLAYTAACFPLLALLPAETDPDHRRAFEEFGQMMPSIWAKAREAEAPRPHDPDRALPQAESLWRTWRAIGDEVGRRVALASQR